MNNCGQSQQMQTIGINLPLATYFQSVCIIYIHVDFITLLNILVTGRSVEQCETISKNVNCVTSHAHASSCACKLNIPVWGDKCPTTPPGIFNRQFKVQPSKSLWSWSSMEPYDIYVVFILNLTWLKVNWQWNLFSTCTFTHLSHILGQPAP